MSPDAANKQAQPDPGDLVVVARQQGEHMTVHAPPRALLDQLEAAGREYELLPHRRTNTAAAEAEALGLEPREVAKTLVLVTPDGFVLAIILASQRLNLHKVRAFLDSNKIELASEVVLAGAYPEFELGAVPPTGAHGERVLIDPRVCENEYTVLEAGTHEQSLRIKTADLITMNHALVEDICRG
jgi:Ala-tRNA(Pro) deacylase